MSGVVKLWDCVLFIYQMPFSAQCTVNKNNFSLIAKHNLDISQKKDAKRNMLQFFVLVFSLNQ